MLLTKQHINSLHALCEKHNVEKLYVFGSYATNTLNEESDIDLLVKFKEIDLTTYFLNFLAFKEKLKKIFKRDVDLIEEQTLKNPILIQSINKNKALIYG